MSSAPRRVLVTRPEPGCSRTAEALRDAGLEAICLPFTETRALEPEWPQIMPDTIVVTSANAIRFMDETARTRFSGLPVFCVGDATAAQARRCGFADVHSVDGDVQALVAVMAKSGARRWLYPCGRIRKPVIEEFARDAALELNVCETYDTEKVSELTDLFDGFLARQVPDAIMVHSGVSAAILVDLCEAENVKQALEKTIVFAISPGVAEPLEDVFPGRVHAAIAPRDDAMIDLAIRHLKVPGAV